MLINLTELFACQLGHKEKKEIMPELEVFTGYGQAMDRFANKWSKDS